MTHPIRIPLSSAEYSRNYIEHLLGSVRMGPRFEGSGGGTVVEGFKFGVGGRTNLLFMTCGDLDLKRKQHQTHACAGDLQ